MLQTKAPGTTGVSSHCPSGANARQPYPLSGVPAVTTANGLIHGNELIRGNVRLRAVAFGSDTRPSGEVVQGPGPRTALCGRLIPRAPQHADLNLHQSTPGVHLGIPPDECSYSLWRTPPNAKACERHAFPPDARVVSRGQGAGGARGHVGTSRIESNVAARVAFLTQRPNAVAMIGLQIMMPAGSWPRCQCGPRPGTSGVG
jgi:hypothetical protein